MHGRERVVESAVDWGQQDAWERGKQGPAGLDASPRPSAPKVQSPPTVHGTATDACGSVSAPSLWRFPMHMRGPINSQLIILIIIRCSSKS